MAHETLDNPDPRDPGMIEKDSVPTSNPAPTVPGNSSVPGVNQTPREDIGDLEDRQGFEIRDTSSDESDNRSR